MRWRDFMDPIKSKLSKYGKKTITLDELTNLFGSISSYDDFFCEINKLVSEKILIDIPQAGQNGISKPLSNKYRINKSVIQDKKTKLINEKILKTSSIMSLENYFNQELGVFLEEESYIDRINDYLIKNGLPKKMLIPELSFLLVGNEKWIEDGPGKKVLKHLAIWDKLDIITEPDPVAFAVNERLKDKDIQKHLIIENKTPFLHLMNAINESEFNTVIYGQGWKIVSGLKIFEAQYPFGSSHEFYYFGDVDYEGISIFQTLKERYNAIPAFEFYQKLFDLSWSKGKENQRENRENIKDFIKLLEEISTDSIHLDHIPIMLEKGYYQPQEILSKEQLIELMR